MKTILARPLPPGIPRPQQAHSRPLPQPQADHSRPHVDLGEITSVSLSRRRRQTFANVTRSHFWGRDCSAVSTDSTDSTDKGRKSAQAALNTFVGIVGLLSSFVSAAVLSTTAEKLLGVAVCLVTAVAIYCAARDRDRGMLSNPLMISLCGAGLVIVALIVVLAGRPVPSAGEQQADGSVADGSANQPDTTHTESSTDEPTTTSTMSPSSSSTSVSVSPSSPQSDTIWLVDMVAVVDDSDWTTKPVEVSSKPYDKSFVVGPEWCFQTQLEYVISGKYSRFIAMVGLSDHSTSTEPLDFYILADDKKIKMIPDVGIAAPQRVDVSVEGVTRLALGIEMPLDASRSCPETTGVWINPSLTPATM